MSLSHAIAWFDHHNAQVLRIDAEHVQLHKVKEHSHYTRQHGSSVRSEHDFFGELCDALIGFNAVLITGSQKVQADFRHYVDSLAPRW